MSAAPPNIALHWQPVVETLAAFREELLTFQLEMERLLDDVDRLHEHLQRRGRKRDGSISKGPQASIGAEDSAEMKLLRQLLAQQAELAPPGERGS
jgi:hypothetical protein